MAVRRFFSLLFVALNLAPSLAHLLELPNKIGLSHDDYLTVQQIYRGWSLLGIVVAGALLSTFLLTLKVRKLRKTFALTLTALLCLIGSQIIFWVLTFPTNQVTSNWTTLPSDWEALRKQWEYSHAAAAVLNFCALVSLILSTVSNDGD